MNDKKQIKIIRDGCLVDFLNQEMKELQIAEMKKAIRAVLENRNDIMYIPYLAEPIAEKLVKDGYIKPLPNCIMLSREEHIALIREFNALQHKYNNICDRYRLCKDANETIKQHAVMTRKETAREILDDICHSNLGTTTIEVSSNHNKEDIKIACQAVMDLIIDKLQKLAKQYEVEIKE